MLHSLRNKLQSASSATDALFARAAILGRDLFLWPVIFAIALGAGLWMLLHSSQLAVLDTNKLPQPDRIRAVIWVAASAAAVAIVYAGAMAFRRIQRGSFRAVETAAALNRSLTCVIALPFIAALRLPAIEKSGPKLALFFIAAAGLAVGRSVYALSPSSVDAVPHGADDDSGPPGAARRIRSALARWLPPIAVFLLWVGYGYFFSRLSITNHHALNTRTTDLGYYDNIFYQSIHGRPLGCSFVKAGYHGSAHFDPILVLLSPLYLLYPRTELLLSLQSVWLGAGVIPVYLIACEKLRSRPAAVLLGVMYLAYPALHGANMYEFHSLSLITPLVLWLLYFLEIGAPKRYFAMLFALLLCREDVPLLMCFVGLYAIMSLRPGAARIGRYTIFISIVYFILAKSLFMTSSSLLGAGKDSYSYAYYYEELIPDKSGAAQLLVSLVTNPIFALKVATEEAKLNFFLILFLPVVFLPFLAKTGRIMLVYGLAFCLLASRDPVFSVHFQYTSVLIPFVFMLTPVALRRIEDSPAPSFSLDGRRLSRALLGGALVAALLVSWKFGAILENASFRGGFVPVARTLSEDARQRYAWIREQVAKIPPGASVAATNRLGPHISNRQHAYFYGDKTTDYAFVDEAELKGGTLDKHTKALSRGDLVEVSRLGKIALFKRKGVR